jgi:TolB-like protein/DNA-binding winged helix-turn-helix (wHTH) protein
MCVISRQRANGVGCRSRPLGWEAMRYEFEDFALDTDRRELCKGDRPIAVQPQVFDVLTYLIANRDHVVAKESLLDAVWGGRIVSESTFSSRINAARIAIGDSGEYQRLIRTASRKGFRFVGAVQEGTSKAPPKVEISPIVDDVARPPVEQDAPGGAPRLSLVVLPFANLSGGPDYDPFVDGLTENLTTDLSRIRGSFVISRHTAFTYKGKAFELKQIGRDLRVRYALEGSVQKSGDHLRINAQLVDAETGAHIWAERFDKPISDLFAMQDEIVTRVARQLDAALVIAEARRAERAPHPDSIDFFFRGLADFNKGFDPTDFARARAFFAEALRIDPDNADALVYSAFVDANLAAANFAAHDGAARLAAAERNAGRALSLVPDHAWGQSALGFVLGLTNRAELAIARTQRALELDPNLAPAHGLMGLHKLHLGRAVETEGHVREALRLSPRDPSAFIWFAIVGFAKNSLGLYEEAIPWLRQSINRNRKFTMSHFHLGAALAHLDRNDEARGAAAAGLALDPTFTLASFRAAQLSDDPVYLAWRDRVIDGMRLAGIPEV